MISQPPADWCTNVGPVSLLVPTNSLLGFSVSVDNTNFYWATANIQGTNTVVVTSPISNPAYVRYGWSWDPGLANLDNSHGSNNLYNVQGLPALVFRSDEMLRPNTNLCNQTPFATWAAANGLDGSPGKAAGFLANPANDGMCNGFKWILGLNPLVRTTTPFPEVGVDDDDDLLLTFSRNHATVGATLLVVQWSTDLLNWHDVSIGASSSWPDDPYGVTVTVTPNGAMDNIVVTVPAYDSPTGTLYGRIMTYPSP